VRGNATRPLAVFPQLRSLSDNKSHRPISPHVTIYKFPLPAIASITHRLTGIGLTVGFYGAAMVALFGACDWPTYIHSFKAAAPVLVPLVKGLVAFPLTYHTVNGIRHVYWDLTAKGIDTATMEKSSQVVIGTSAVLTLFLMAYETGSGKVHTDK